MTLSTVVILFLFPLIDLINFYFHFYANTSKILSFDLLKIGKRIYLKDLFLKS